MAVGIKGNTGGGGGGRGRSYGLMLMLAFGAALFGVMVVHKLRDRRIFNLLVKEKDRQIISLQLLLQKERESTQEEKRKIEELKAKMLSLKSQKIDLHSRVMEMQSTIASLRDEHKTLEIAFEEKQNEIQMLQERDTDSSIKESPEVIALKEMLKQREAEIEDLNHHLDPPTVNNWSVSADDPSNPAVNITARESMLWENKTDARSEGKEQNEHFHEAARVETEDGHKETTGEAKSQKPENVQDDVKDVDQGNENKDSQQELDLDTREGKDNPNAQAVSKSEVGKTVEEDSSIKVMGNEEHDITRNELLEKLENVHGGEGQKLGIIPKGGMKMELPGSSMTGAGSSTGRYAGKTKEKRWRILTKSRGVENNGSSGNSRAATTRRRKISKDKRNKFPTTDTSQRIRQKYETGNEYGSSEVENHVPDLVTPTGRISSEAADITGSAEEPRKKVREGRNFHKAAEHAEVNEDPEDLEVEDIYRQEKEAAAVDTSFRNVFENNTEGYKDETDEPEF